MIDKDTSTIIIRKGAVQRKVVYNAETKFTVQNKPGGSIDDVIGGQASDLPWHVQRQDPLSGHPCGCPDEVAGLRGGLCGPNSTQPIFRSSGMQRFLPAPL